MQRSCKDPLIEALHWSSVGRLRRLRENLAKRSSPEILRRDPCKDPSTEISWTSCSSIISRRYFGQNLAHNLFQTKIFYRGFQKDSVCEPAPDLLGRLLFGHLKNGTKSSEHLLWLLSCYPHLPAWIPVTMNFHHPLGVACRIALELLPPQRPPKHPWSRYGLSSRAPLPGPTVAGQEAASQLCSDAHLGRSRLSDAATDPFFPLVM